MVPVVAGCAICVFALSCRGNASRTTGSVTTSAVATSYPVEEKTVAALQQEMAAGRVSSEQLVRVYLQRIHDIDQSGPALHAVISVNPSAVADARRRDEERSGGRIRGPLHGIPVVLKDNIESADHLPTTSGSLALKDNITERDAPVVARLRDTGAVMLGKTNLSEWAGIRSIHGTGGWSAIGGLTRNPYALDRSAAGSSAGSAVAVAANLGVVAVGTETNGSITMPAAFNGVVGLKPTVGLVSRTHIIPITSMQDTAGPLTRTVSDAALMLTIMAGTDAADPATREADAHKHDYTTGLSVDALRGKRLGIMKFTMGYLPSVDEAFGRAVDHLESLGAKVLTIDKFDGMDKIDADMMAVFQADFRIELNRYLADTPKSVRVRSLKDLIAFNAANASHEMPFFGQDLLEQAERAVEQSRAVVEKLRARNRKAAGIDGIDRLLQRYKIDALIAPSTHPAFPIDLINGDHILGGSPTLAAVAGYPHLTVPMSHIQGLPVGISFVGPAWSEGTLLAMGYAFEQRVGGRRPPTFPAGAETRAAVRDGGASKN